jgi:hypothetical protein
MSTVAEIKEAIERLSPQERCELEALLHPRADDDWDREMQADAAAGKFDVLKDEAAAERRAGKLRDFPKPRNP